MELVVDQQLVLDPKCEGSYREFCCFEKAVNYHHGGRMLSLVDAGIPMGPSRLKCSEIHNFLEEERPRVITVKNGRQIGRASCGERV